MKNLMLVVALFDRLAGISLFASGKLLRGDSLQPFPNHGRFLLKP